MSSSDRFTNTRTLLIDEAARVMGVSRRTVYYRIREGRLSTIRTRCGSQRVVVPSLDELVEEGRHRNAGRRSVRVTGTPIPDSRGDRLEIGLDGPLDGPVDDRLGLVTARTAGA